MTVAQEPATKWRFLGPPGLADPDSLKASIPGRSVRATGREPGRPARSGPMATRTRRSVGKPTAAVIRRTWRFRPSRRVRRSQAVGHVLAEPDRHRAVGQ